MEELTIVLELMEIVNKTTNAEEALLFIKERDMDIQCPQPKQDDNLSKNKHKKRNLKGGKGKKTKTDAVLVDVPDKRHSSSQGMGK